MDRELLLHLDYFGDCIVLDPHIDWAQAKNDGSACPARELDVERVLVASAGVAREFMPLSERGVCPFEHGALAAQPSDAFR